MGNILKMPFIGLRSWNFTLGHVLGMFGLHSWNDTGWVKFLECHSLGYVLGISLWGMFLECLGYIFGMILFG